MKTPHTQPPDLELRRLISKSMKTPRIEEKEDWEKKVLSMRGYNHLEGEAYIVLEKENMIWNSEELKNFIHHQIKKAHQAGRDEERKRIIKIASRGKDAFMVLPTLNRFIKALQDNK
jgi:hypothetical protein